MLQQVILVFNICFHFFKEEQHKNELQQLEEENRKNLIEIEKLKDNQAESQQAISERDLVFIKPSNTLSYSFILGNQKVEQNRRFSPRK